MTDGVLQQFLELGVDVNAKDANGGTPLDFAVRQIDNVKVELLLNFGGIPGNNSSTGRTVLHDLHRSTDSISRRLLDLRLDLNAGDGSGATPLDLAVRQSDIVKFCSLYRLGGIPGEHSAPPLTEAVVRGNSQLVNFPLGTKSDPNLLGNSQKTAISSAAEKKDREIVSALRKAGADPNLEDRTMVSPLARAMLNKDKEIGQLLIESGPVIQLAISVA